MKPTEMDLTGVVGTKSVHLYATGFKNYITSRNVYDTAVNTATLWGTSGNDVFAGALTGCTMTLSTGVSYRINYLLTTGSVPRGFDRVQVNAAGGNDTVTLTGATTGSNFSGTNSFVANATDAVLSDGTLDMTDGDLLAASAYYYKVSGLSAGDSLTAKGGLAPAVNNRRVNGHDYALAYTGTWNDV
jgi:hypothetical protein